MELFDLVTKAELLVWLGTQLIPVAVCIVGAVLAALTLWSSR